MGTLQSPSLQVDTVVICEPIRSWHYRHSSVVSWWKFHITNNWRNYLLGDIFCFCMFLILDSQWSSAIFSELWKQISVCHVLYVSMEWKKPFLKPFGSFEFAGWLLHWEEVRWFQQGTTWSVPTAISFAHPAPPGFFRRPPKKIDVAAVWWTSWWDQQLEVFNFSCMAYVLLRVRPLALLGKKDRRMVLRLKKLKRKKKTQQINSAIQMTRWWLQLL